MYASIEAAVADLDAIAPNRYWIRRVRTEDFGGRTCPDWLIVAPESWLIYEGSRVVGTATTLDEAMAAVRRGLDPAMASVDDEIPY